MSATLTWTRNAAGNYVLTVTGASGSESGGGIPGGDNTQIQFNALGEFEGSSGFIYISSTAAPSVPVLATVGTPGVTTRGYKLVFRTPTGTSRASTQATIATGHATLNGSNYITVTVPACSGVGETVDIYLTTGGGNTPTLGFLANVPCGTVYNHQGQDGNSYSVPPTDDTTQGPLIINDLAILRHAAIGNSAQVDDIRFIYPDFYGTDGIVLNVAETFTELTGAQTTGVGGYFELNPSAPATTVFTAMDNQINVAGAQTYTNIIAVNGTINHNANSTIELATSGFQAIYNNDDGDITNAKGVWSEVQNFGAGSIDVAHTFHAGQPIGNFGTYAQFYADSPSGVIATLGYGLYIKDQNLEGITDAYNIYSAGAASRNVFEGIVKINSLKTSGAASGKKVVCVDLATGQLYASSTGVDCSN